jgi:dipeptidyl-peptidase-4
MTISFSAKHILLVAAATMAYGGLSAQKKQFTIAEATNGMSTTLALKSIKNPSWQPGTNRFWQTVKRSEADVWSATTLEKENTAEETIEQGTYPEKVTSIAAIKWIDQSHVYFINGKKVITGNLQGDKFSWKIMAALPDNAEHITVDKTMQVAYTIDNNLWLWDKENGKTQVSHEQDRNVVCGQPVHRDEFGIDNGIFFSPAGNYIAYYCMDQTMVNDYPIIKWDATPAKADLIKYPMAGGTSHEVTLKVFNPATGATVTMQTGTKNRDHYLTAVTWSPDERYIYIAILNREQNHLWLNKYSARTGEKLATLFEETDPKYVHPTHPLTFLPGRDNQFIWWSERDGYNHLYLYSTNGTLISQMTKGKWVVNELAGINTSAHTLIVTASKESPLEKHIYSVNYDNGDMVRIDKGAGMHTALCSDDGKYVLDTYNGAGTPKKTTIFATNGTYSRELLSAPNTLANYDRPVIKDITIKADDGVTPLYGKLILPTHFDPHKKYPVIVYLYNGPNVQLIHNSFPESGNLWYEYMAQHGYIVFTMDGRGSWNRGMAFEQATFRNLGDVEMKDQLKGVAYLKSLPYVDSRRMGVHGWSYGGFMTTSLMLKYPGVFKCAVAGGPVMDWKLYEVMYTERYMDTPEDNPDGYAKSNLLDKVKDLKGKLMLIHGTNDNVVVWQHSINFLKKCVDENVQVDYFVYPGYEHNVRGKDRAHLMQKISDYFDQYLKK